MESSGRKYFYFGVIELGVYEKGKEKMRNDFQEYKPHFKSSNVHLKAPWVENNKEKWHIQVSTIS